VLITATWLRLDGRQRWRSLVVLAVLIGLGSATVLTAIAGARRGDSAFSRLWARTLPATATGHALSTAVRRRRHDLAVLRALGMTRRQSRLVVTTQASLLAVIGLLLGVPLGIALGRSIWRAVAGFTPLAYHSPLAPLTLLLVGPIALLAANVLAAWPQRRAAGVRAAQVLRSE
jgi:predicted lysophospholipase L1 biosynthesis ABC-type transport system permease subunit